MREVILCAIILAGVLLARWEFSGSSSSLKEVHEWGTMTGVVGTDGHQFAWWRLDSFQQPEEVPEFVQSNPLGGKSSWNYVQRMETPVLYFYPSKPMPIEVSVQFEEGRITEFFPSDGLVEGTRPYETGRVGAGITWHLNLLPPDSEKAKLIPLVGKKGSQYAAAREVPDAWLVQRELNNREIRDSTQPKRSRSDEVEKFLFYRGASDVWTPLYVYRHERETLELLSRAGIKDDKFHDIWILKVSGDRAAWKRVNPLRSENHGYPSTLTEIPILPAERTAPNPDQVSAELRAEIQPALVRNGLSEAEANAMLNTWNDTWFKEPGLRILYLLPRQWVDTHLPLTIKPAPQKLERVFMARVEVLTPSAEKALLVLLDRLVENADFSAGRAGEDFSALIDSAADLQLGRFLSAGLQRAIHIREEQRQGAVRALEEQIKEKRAPVK